MVPLETDIFFKTGFFFPNLLPELNWNQIDLDNVGAIIHIILASSNFTWKLLNLAWHGRFASSSTDFNLVYLPDENDRNCSLREDFDIISLSKCWYWRDGTDQN